MRFRLRTLMILMAVGPPMLAGLWYVWPRVEAKRRNSPVDMDIFLGYIVTEFLPDEEEEKDLELHVEAQSATDPFAAK